VESLGAAPTRGMRQVAEQTQLGLEVKITDRCNQRCAFCMNSDGPDGRDQFDASWLERRLSDWASDREGSGISIREVRMTGGEPLLNLPAVLEICRVSAGYGIPVGINTNATLLDGATALQLKQAGLETVKASLDTIDPATHATLRGAHGSLEASLAGIRTALDVGLKVILRFTLSASSRSSLLDCYRLARELDVHLFQVKPLVNSGRANESGAFLTRDEVRAALFELARAADDDDRVQVLCWRPEEAAGLDTKVCGSADKLYLDASGKAFICNYVDDRLPLGDLCTEPLDQIASRRGARFNVTAEGHSVPLGCPLWQPEAD